ncbi:DUF4913 domain-containing protein [Cellulomonas fimi]|uniref:DUF4913 domain-containing protein n=1 Tax=Cellulomonas fimi TaxID=1708 RepID=UPI0009FE293B|nr:DUF4913 domain-containing protein [Cellulomonas fimi]NNH09192.1 DUF4913 domain-containing protein [Cellulomonas fimi]
MSPPSGTGSRDPQPGTGPADGPVRPDARKGTGVARSGRDAPVGTTTSVVRLEALSRASEHPRHNPRPGVSEWWRDHADHHMVVLMDPDGPFPAPPEARRTPAGAANRCPTSYRQHECSRRSADARKPFGGYVSWPPPAVPLGVGGAVAAA